MNVSDLVKQFNKLYEPPKVAAEDVPEEEYERAVQILALCLVYAMFSHPEGLIYVNEHLALFSRWTFPFPVDMRKVIRLAAELSNTLVGLPVDSAFDAKTADFRFNRGGNFFSVNGTTATGKRIIQDARLRMEMELAVDSGNLQEVLEIALVMNPEIIDAIKPELVEMSQAAG